VTTHQQLKGDLLMKRTALAKIHELDTALQPYWTPDHVIDFRQALWGLTLIRNSPPLLVETVPPVER